MPRSYETTDVHPVDARQRVRAEMDMRGLSERGTAMRAEISNTTLNKYLVDNRVTKTIRLGLERAFDWPHDWPENPPPMPEAREDQLLTLVAGLADQVLQLAVELRELREEVRQLRR